MEHPRAKLEAAKTATELFGPLLATPATKRAAKRLYRVLVQEVHPDKGGSKELFQKLQGFYDTWSEGKPEAPAKTQVQAGPWTVGDLVAKGSISNLYRATTLAAQLEGVVKIARKPSSNGFLQAEATALMTLNSSAPQNHLYPELIDHGRVGDREYLVLPDLSAWRTLQSLGKLDGRDYAWMHRRLLGALAGAHAQGIVHGAVLPEHVLITEDHQLKLIGWSFSGKPGEKIPARVQSRATMYPWSPTEETLSPEFDVYMAHSLLKYMLPRDEMRQHHFARGCMSNTPAGRPSALDALRDYDALLLRLYGKRTFRPFTFPPSKEN